MLTVEGEEQCSEHWCVLFTLNTFKCNGGSWCCEQAAVASLLYYLLWCSSYRRAVYDWSSMKSPVSVLTQMKPQSSIASLPLCLFPWLSFSSFFFYNGSSIVIDVERSCGMITVIERELQAEESKCRGTHTHTHTQPWVQFTKKTSVNCTLRVFVSFFTQSLSKTVSIHRLLTYNVQTNWQSDFFNHNFSNIHLFNIIYSLSLALSFSELIWVHSQKSLRTG